MIVQVRPTAQLIPPHEVRDPDKFQKLALLMETSGWDGRPILALKFGPHYFALTGSHRIAAARAAGLHRIPVRLINRRGWDAWANEINASNPTWRYRAFWPGDPDRILESPAWRELATQDDDIKADTLRDIDRAAAELMLAEWEANNGD